MRIDEEKLHDKLPIGKNEKIIAVIRHHWFAYASVYFGAGCLCLLILIGIVFAIVTQSQLGISDNAVSAILACGLIAMVVICAFSAIPVYIKKQERLILTEEAILELKKPSLFANNISQLNLAHIADVTVRQDTLGTMFGFGHLVIETPGEQDNYSFSVVAQPREMAKRIIEAHENYAAALESGQILTTLGQRPPVPGTAWRNQAPTPPPIAQNQSEPEVDPKDIKDY